MGTEEKKSFESLEEELNYWKELANIRLLEKQELQREFNDYTEESRQLEREYEISLEQSESSIKNLNSERLKLQSEIESLKNRFEQSSREVSQLQTELTELKTEMHQTTSYIRELEQKNDDLERTQRVFAESIAAAESTLNTAIERNAILESEIDEKEQLKTKLQRLMDEIRDLKQELNVRERNTVPDNERGLTNGRAITPIDSNRLLTEIENQTNNVLRPKSPTKRDPNNSFPMTPSARHSALNLVGDILRKMGSLEAKVAACRNRDYSQNLESRYRRLSRAAATNPNNNNSTVQNTTSILH